VLFTGGAGGRIGDVGTGADVRDGSEETQMSATSVGSRARILAELLLAGNSPNFHQSFQTVTQDGALFACCLVYSFDRLTLPI